MSERYEPEMGQAVFGTPYAEFATGDLGEACVRAVLDEIHRVFWNVHQKKWDEYTDPEIKGVIFRPYYWGEEETEALKPNLAAHGVEVRWYKHPGRGETVATDMTPDGWSAWLSATLTSVRAADVRIP